jgi:hypothetical protein
MQQQYAYINIIYVSWQIVDLLNGLYLPPRMFSSLAPFTPPRGQAERVSDLPDDTGVPSHL